MITILHLRARNDANGNPRRLYVTVEDNEIVGVYDEGYLGKRAIPVSARFGPDGDDYISPALTVDITVSDYRRLLRAYGDPAVA